MTMEHTHSAQTVESQLHWRLPRVVLCAALLCVSAATARSQPPVDYSSYFESILNIEEAISREEFQQAVNSYGQLFDRYDRAFARDAYNACQLAALTDDDRFDGFFLRCAKSGVPLFLLLRNGHIARRYSRDSLHLRQLFEGGRTLYLSRIDTALRNEFAMRFELEQRNKGGEAYRAICTSNFNRIVELVGEGRFPGEAVIGPDDDLENSHVLSTLLHYPYSYTVLDSVLWSAVRSGNAQPFMVLYLYGFNQTRTSVLYDNTVPADTVHYGACYNLPFGKRSADLAAVNRQRWSRWLFSTEVEARLNAVAAKYRLDYKPGG